MPKLTKQAEKEHEQAEALLALPRDLTADEKVEVFEKFRPGARHLQGKNAAFFTPWEVADVVAQNTATQDRRILDLGAGIGILAYVTLVTSSWEPPREIVCIELNPEYVEVGKRLVPEATWICGDIFDLALLRSLGRFHAVMSNPPFGAVHSGLASKDWLAVSKGAVHMQAVEVALRMTEGTIAFVLPQVDLPWRYSMFPRDLEMVKKFSRTARRGYKFTIPERRSQNLKRLLRAFPDVDFGCTSVDLGCYTWKEVEAAVEVVRIGFDPPLDVSLTLPEPEVLQGTLSL